MFSIGQNRSTEKCYEKVFAKYSKKIILKLKFEQNFFYPF